jgi:predicted 3-demethylubiquinone-9 3-methyltransferase (glyoxalase superfamily)
MQKITPFLWFEDNLEEALEFYLSVFKNARRKDSLRLDEQIPKGKVTTATLEIECEDFMFLNGGPVNDFKFSPAISFFVLCENQEEIDDLWQKLTAGGKEMQCGWLTDKFGVTWQIVPRGFSDLIGGSDPEGAKRATAAMMTMIKLDVGALQRAYDGE